MLIVSWPESSCSSPVTLKQTFFPFLSPFSLSLSAGIKGSGVLRSDFGEYVIEERRLRDKKKKKSIFLMFFKSSAPTDYFSSTSSKYYPIICHEITSIQFISVWNTVRNRGWKWYLLLLKSVTVDLIML